MLKSMLLDCTDVDIAFIYKTQLKIELSADLKCRDRYQVWVVNAWTENCEYARGSSPCGNAQELTCKVSFLLGKTTRGVSDPTSVSRKASIKPRHAQGGQTHPWGTDKGAMPASFPPCQQSGLALARYLIIFQEFPLFPNILTLHHSVSVLR